MPFVSENQLTLEKSPAYFRMAEVPKIIKNWNPKAKFIIIIRDPVKRSVSHFTHDFVKQFPKVVYDSNKYDNVSEYFDQMMLHINGQVKLNTCTVPGMYDHEIYKYTESYKNFFNKLLGLYVKHYKNWLKFFKKKNFLFINGEMLIKNPYQEVQKVEKFLNLRPFIQKENFAFDSNRGFYCIRYDLFNPENITCLKSSKGRKHPFISNNTIIILKKFFRKFDHELFGMINEEPYWDTEIK